MIEWKDHEYGSGCSTTIQGVFDISVSWKPESLRDDDRPPYAIFVFERQLKKRFDDIEKAKTYALSFALNKLKKATKDIEEN